MFLTVNFPPTENVKTSPPFRVCSDKLLTSFPSSDTFTQPQPSCVCCCLVPRSSSVPLSTLIPRPECHSPSHSLPYVHLLYSLPHVFLIVLLATYGTSLDLGETEKSLCAVLKLLSLYVQYNCPVCVKDHEVGG